MYFGKVRAIRVKNISEKMCSFAMISTSRFKVLFLRKNFLKGHINIKWKYVRLRIVRI